MSEQFENGRNLTVKNSLQGSDTKQCTFDLRIELSHSGTFKSFVFIIFKSSHDAVSKNVPFSYGRRHFRYVFHRFQNVPSSCERCLRGAPSQKL